MASSSVKAAAVACAFASLASLSNAGPVQVNEKSFVPEGVYVPPYYPAPYGGWVDDWKSAYSKAKTLVDSMTLAEKTNITGGTGIFMGE